MVVVMLEEVEALANLDDVLKVEHVDVFFVAPGDLAQSMGLPGQMDHPKVQAAIDDAVARIVAAGVPPASWRPRRRSAATASAARASSTSGWPGAGSRPRLRGRPVRSA